MKICLTAAWTASTDVTHHNMAQQRVTHLCQGNRLNATFSEGYRNKIQSKSAVTGKTSRLFFNLCNLDSSLHGILPKWKEMTDS